MSTSMKNGIAAGLAGFAVFFGTELPAQGQVVLVNDLGLLQGDAGVGAATNAQQEHAVAAGASGHLVVWSDWRGRSVNSQTVQSDGDIFGIRVDDQGAPIDGAPFLIAGGMGLQRYPNVAWNGENWLVVYESQDAVGGYYDTNIRAVRVSPSGIVLDATPILLPTAQFSSSTIGLQVAGTNGQWMITRCVYHGDGYGTFLAGQRIGGNGALLDDQPLVLLDWVYGPTRLLTMNGEYVAVGPDWNNSSVIKAQRVTSGGQGVGSAFALPSMNIATNGTELYVAWISGFVNLVGSRVDATGALVNPSGTLLVGDYSQYNQCVVSHDGTNWWMLWGGADILRTLRIDATGNVLDANGGVLLPITIGGNINQAYEPQMTPRAGGGVEVLWYDVRVSMGYDTNVYALPISASNVPGNERCVSTSTRNQRSVDMAEGPAGMMAVAYVSELANDDRVMVRMLNQAGEAVTATPIEIAAATTIGRCGIAWNGTVYMVTWDESVGSGLTPTQIKARRVDSQGALLDAGAQSVMAGFNPDVGALGSNFLIAGARHATYPQFIDLWGRRYDGTTGNALDATSILLASGYVSGAARVRSDGSQWLVCAHSMWSHDSSQGDALLARVPASGPPLAAINPTPVAGGTGDPDIGYSGTNYLLVWRMNTLSNANNWIAGRIVNSDWTYSGGQFTIAEAPGRQLRPTVTWDGENFVVAWDDQRNQDAFFDARTDVYGARVSVGGTVLDPGGFAIAANPEGDAEVSLVSEGNGVTHAATARFTVTGGLDSYRIGLTRIGPMPFAGDVNGDQIVNIDDLTAVILNWGVCAPPPKPCPADLTGDGAVNIDDLTEVLLNWMP